MTENNLKLNISTPDQEIFAGDIASANIPGSEGEFTILPGHISFITTLQTGIITVEFGGKKQFILHDGFASVSKNEAFIISENCFEINHNIKQTLRDLFAKTEGQNRKVFQDMIEFLDKI